MLRMKLLVVLGTLCLTMSAASAQICPLNGTTSKKLVCLIPQVYGPYGFGFGAANQSSAQSVLFTGDNHAAHFDSDFLTAFAPINEAVGIQVSQLPLASPSSGISFVYDANLKTIVPSTDESLGPILGDRASTIGRNKLFLGFSYQYFNFNQIDGQDLSTIPTILQHQPYPCPGGVCTPPQVTPCANQTALTGTNYEGDPCFVRDYIQTLNNIDLKVHQYTIYVTYGITKHLDFSAAIPLLDVRMNVTSDATIVPNSVAPPAANSPGNFWHVFNNVTTATNQADPTLVAKCANQVPCLRASFSDSGTASGIGDVVLRAKYTLYQWEKAGIAAGVDVRLPTGDETNFLGSGTYGVKPFGVFSYKARVSPHAEIGYEKNGDSTLAGGAITGTGANKGALPNRFLYIVGADVAVVKRLTADFEIYGQHLFDAPKLVSQPYTDLGNCANLACNSYTAGTSHVDIAQRTSGIDITDASLGAKFRAFKNLVLTGNVLLKLNDAGLRAKAVPLFGASYSF